MMTKFALRSLIYHEGVPGHHFQIALTVENRDLPRFRQIGAFPAESPRCPKAGDSTPSGWPRNPAGTTATRRAGSGNSTTHCGARGAW